MQGIERVDIELTSRCNLNCIHCHAEAGALNYTELSFNTLKRLIDDLSNNGVQRICLGGGEPLFYKNISETIEYARKKDICVEIVTNGTLINCHNYKIFKNIDVIYVSIFSTNADTHNKITNTENSYSSTLNGLDILQSLGLKINIITVANKLNFKEILGLNKLFINLNINKIYVLQLFPLGRANKELMLTYYQWKYLIDNANKNYEFYINYNDTNGCPARKYPCITSSGDIIPCKILRKSFVFGNINNNTFSYIWNDSNLDFLFPTQKEIIGGCSKCKSWESCMGGCRGLAFLISGNMNKSDPLCWRNFNV